MEVTQSFVDLLSQFAAVFTQPTYPRFVLLMSGWILSHRHRFVTDLIISSDSVGNGHFSDYHRFFSQAAWSIDQLWKVLAHMLVAAFVGPAGVILLVADDTLCHKRGLSLFGGGMHHDPLISSRAMKLVSWGHDWVVLCLVVSNPWWAPGKVFALPICARLYRNRQGLTKGQKKEPRQSRPASTGRSGKKGTKRAKKQARQARRKAARATRRTAQVAAEHRTRPELLVEMLVMVAGWFPARTFQLCVDSLYSGGSVLQHLPANMHLIGPVHSAAALYEVPQPSTGRGRRRKKGKRLPNAEAWANDKSAWEKLNFDQYGLHAELEVKSRTGLYYKAGKDRLLKFLLVRDVSGGRPTRIFYSTDLERSNRDILSDYACRWSIEVTFHDSKQHLGLEDPANRTPLAVERTAPMALFLYSLTVLWYHEHGHRHVEFPNRPWYRRKSQPSFADMLTTLRRESWKEKLSEVRISNTRWKKVLRLLQRLATLAG